MSKIKAVLKELLGYAAILLFIGVLIAVWVIQAFGIRIVL